MSVRVSIKDQKLSAEEVEALKAELSKRSETAFCEEIGVSRSTLYRALAGLAVRRSSAMAIRATMKAIAAGEFPL